MYRWNSRVPTARWKDNCLDDRGSAASTNDILASEEINDSNNPEPFCSKKNGSESGGGSSCCVVASGNLLSGSSLTSAAASTDPTNPLTVVEPRVGLPNLVAATTVPPPSTFPLSTTSGPGVVGQQQQQQQSSLDSGSIIPGSPPDDLESRHRDWNVIRTVWSVGAIVLRELRTLSLPLLIGLLVNPINYCICRFSPVSLLSSRLRPAAGFPSIGRTVPGGSSTSYYYSCKRRNSTLGCCNSGGAASRPASSLILRLRCCTCNFISFLRPIFGECCCTRRGGGVGVGGYKKDNNNSSNSGAAATHHSYSRSGVGKPRRLGKMAQILSKTMTLLGVAFVIHFIIMSTFAEKEGFAQPRYAPDESRKYHYHHHYHDEMEIGAGKRLARSYRHDKQHPTPVPDNVVASLTGHHARLLSNNKSEAVFSTENSTVIIAQIGSKTYLPCAVRNLGSGVASWIRRRDYHLLTVGMGTYSNDDRFMVSHNRPAQSWELHIKFVKSSDEGMYECQISTHPPSSIFVHLRVVEAKAEILGEPDKHVRSGSTFELVCVLRDSTEPPVYVFWYHNDRMINYDNVRGVQVSSDAEKSILTIQEAQKSDSGNYTCVPSNARATSISVHILNGEKPAAMQHGSRNHSTRLIPTCSSLLFVTAVVVFFLTTWLATTNLNQQNLFYLHRRQQQQKQQHQSEDDEEERRRKEHFSNRTPPQRKLEKLKGSHQRNHYHHLYLQLLKELREGFAKPGNSPGGDDNPSIHNESTPFATTLCLLLVLNRRAVEESSSSSCKSNTKEPQPKEVLVVSPAKATSHPPAAPRHHHRAGDIIIITRERDYSLESSSSSIYDSSVPGQVVVASGHKENEGTGEVNMQDQYRKQHHEPTFTLDFEVRSVTLMMSPPNETAECKRLIISPSSCTPQWDSQKVDYSYQPEFLDTVQRRDLSSGGGGFGCGDDTKSLPRESEILTAEAGVAPGVGADEAVTGSQRTPVLTILSEFSSSVKSPSFPCTRRATFPRAYDERFMSILSKDNNSAVEGFDPTIEIVDVLVGTLIGNVVIIRKEVACYPLHHHHHHHFYILFPSACSYYYSLTTSGWLLSSSSPFLPLSSRIVVTPSRRTTSRAIANATTTTTTSFQATLFCSRNKAEASLPPLVKRLPEEVALVPESPSSSSSITVPTTNTTTTTTVSPAAPQPSLDDCRMTETQVVVGR